MRLCYSIDKRRRTSCTKHKSKRAPGFFRFHYVSLTRREKISVARFKALDKPKLLAHLNLGSYHGSYRAKVKTRSHVSPITARAAPRHGCPGSTWGTTRQTALRRNSDPDVAFDVRIPARFLSHASQMPTFPRQVDSRLVTRRPRCICCLTDVL